MPAPVVEHKSFVARDGTTIGYQVSGKGPAVVLSNGLGGTYIAFGSLYEVLEGYRVISWDYRGLYHSGAPKNPQANTVTHQVDDLMEILAREGVDRALLVGWSMGVQVNFEAMRHHAARIAGIMAINGASGQAFHTLPGAKFLNNILPALLKIMKSQAGFIGKATGMVAGTDAMVTAMKTLGMVAPSIDVEIFREVAGGFKTIDYAIYSDLLARLDEHDASDVLPSITVPTTIVTGDKDIMTPASTAEVIHRRIPGSRLVVVKGGTHYTPVEFPEVLQDELRRLLERVPGWRAADVRPPA